mmetsp:Transcript_93561/g.166455  ORF Transcript_93561/g.166455 Transcript_93561/m.166455 type:complete len:152 (+) Transcript_93561:105-560(+)|eukprot:CAMPEP_0197660342 /NCGR_PEP_ID=MMETSP1338-20131121/50791_1 /TAXON_ID=43686 ORGANISM="Pelagodinium beii, Strain RCC1491" /NCGR_SAMPLE_ID=MMETSP1338 /ASSEMBLY_ACC=CAM_ASM_000754 /LENGTH=151 /DNA_ID=CAMNT_0043237675 /DNA_START=53 /DNA_END=508 /DNA_ORIENTATION=+
MAEAEASAVEVTGVVIEPSGPCALETPMSVEIRYLVLGSLPAARWHLRFVADLVHHQTPVELELDPSTTNSSGQEPVKDEGESKPVVAQVRLPRGLASAANLLAAALESLGVLEARLVAEDGKELAVTRLVTDVRRNASGQLERAVLDAFR